MTRRTVSLLAIAIVTAGLLLVAPDVFLVIFAGILLGVLLQGGGHAIARRLGIADGWGVGLFLLVVVVLLGGFGVAIAPTVSTEVDELARRIPESIEEVRRRIEGFSWGKRLTDHLTPGGLFSSEGRAAAASAVTSTFGALGNTVIILFIGLYGALDPDTYRRGATSLLAPSLRDRGEEVLDEAGATLRNWLAAQLMAMTVVGVLTALGLWVAGVSLAFALGLIAGLLAFIPNIGPVLAIAPALLLALPDGQTTVLIVVAIYLTVQALESYIVTPLIQQEKVSLQPALVIAVQLLFGVLFGIFGLALATPIAAVARTLVREVYVADYLEREAITNRGECDRA